MSTALKPRRQNNAQKKPLTQGAQTISTPKITPPVDTVSAPSEETSKTTTPASPLNDSVPLSTTETPVSSPSTNSSSAVQSTDSPSNKSDVTTNGVDEVKDGEPDIDVDADINGDESTRKRREHLLIAPAKVKRYLDVEGLNKVMQRHVAELQTVMAEYKRLKSIVENGKITEFVKDQSGKSTQTSREITSEEKQKYVDALAEYEPKHKLADEQLKAYSKERIRFANMIADVVSIVSGELLKQILTHGSKATILDKKKSVQVYHLFQDGIEKIPLYPLIDNLPVFVEQRQRIMAEITKNETDEQIRVAIIAAERSFKKLYGLKGKKKTDTPNGQADKKDVPVEKKEEKPEPDDTDDDVGTPFKTYVRKVCVAVNEQLNIKVNVSTAVKKFLSDLLVELIGRIGVRARHLLELLCNKTVTQSIIMSIFASQLNERCETLETCEIKDERDPNKLKEETAKQKVNKDHTFNVESIPMVKRAHRSHTYKNSYYPTLEKMIKDELAFIHQDNKPAVEQTQ